MYSGMYNVLFTREAKESIGRLSLKKKRQIKDAVERIAQNPAVGKCLTGDLKGLLSYRSGDYRMIYRVYHKEITVIILTVGHRKDVYR
jgi:mRNA interferase RelE/StbE